MTYACGQGVKRANINTSSIYYDLIIVLNITSSTTAVYLQNFAYAGGTDNSRDENTGAIMNG